MHKIWVTALFIILITGCKTGEIDEISILSEEIRFEITDHLYPGTEVKAITFAGTDHWFYASGNIITEVINSKKSTHPINSPVTSMDWNHTEGALWFGTNSSGLGRLKKGQISYFTKDSHGLPRTEYVRNITCDNEGGVWFNSSAHNLGGAGYFKQGNFAFYTPENSILPDNLVKSIATDGKNVYVATGGTVAQQKLVRIRGNQWELLPVTGYYLMDIAADKNSVVYVIDDYSLSSSFPNNTNIITFDGQKTTSLESDKTEGSWYHPYILATDHRNYLWVAKFGNDFGKTLQVFNGKKWFEPKSFPNDFIHCISIDNRNTVWIGTGNGIFRLEQ